MSIESIVHGVQRNLRSTYGSMSYYGTTYALAELSYWQHCVQWMSEYAKLAPTPPKTILDIGCAYGTLACISRKLWPQACIMGMDAMRYLHPTVAYQYGLEYFLQDVETDGIPEAPPFDVVIMTEVLEHLNFHPLPTLKKVAAAMANKGLLFLSTPDARSWPPAKRTLAEMPYADARAADYEWEDRGHVCQYTADQLHTLLNDAGFVVERQAMTCVATNLMFNINMQARKVGR